MLHLIRNAEVFAPQPMGRQDVLLAGNRIAAVADSIDLAGSEVHVTNASGLWLLPGLVDSLTHPCGGGGEGGFGNRTAEIEADNFIAAGVTTPVGALGTDSITRSLEVLYGQVMKLRTHGLSACMYSGSYRLPAPTLCGDVARDLVLVDPVIGIGEVAISDHRSSQPTTEELRRLAADVQLGGIISGKQGTVLVHVGDGVTGLEPIEDALRGSDLPRRVFYPTHVNRQPGLLKQAAEHARAGGYADITVSTTPELIGAGEIPALQAFHEMVEAGAPADHLTCSSDAGGSLPHYHDGELAGIETASPAALLELLRAAIDAATSPPIEIIAALTRNPADALGLSAKGRIEAGADADLVLLDPDGVNLINVYGMGQPLMRNGQID